MLTKSKNSIILGKVPTRHIATSVVSYQQPTADFEIRGCPVRPNAKQDSDNSFENVKDFSEIPGPKPLPIIGNTWRFLPKIGQYNIQEFNATNKKIRRQYGDIVRMEKIIMQLPTVYVFKPEDIEKVYKSENHHPSRITLPTMTYFRNKKRQEIFKHAKGLVTAEGEEWYNFRNKVNPIMMQPKIVKQYIETVEEITDEFIQKLERSRNSENKLNCNFMTETCKWALESISAVALDSRLGCLRDEVDPKATRIMEASDEILTLFVKLDYKPSIWRLVSTPSFRKIMKAYDDQITLNKEFIDKAIIRIQKNKELGVISDKEPSVLEKLWEIDPNIALVMASDMMFGGIETTSHSLGAILYYLAANPSKQDVLRCEIFSVLPNITNKIQQKNLKELPYLKACIKEAMRLFPVSPGLLRTLIKDIVISGYRIPKGVNITYPMMLISSDDKHFPRPSEYIPERWLRDSDDSELSYKKVHPFCSIPFGFGPRACVGRRFAELELEVAVINFIRNFDISWNGLPPTMAMLGINYFNPPYNFVFKSLK